MGVAEKEEGRGEEEEEDGGEEGEEGGRGEWEDLKRMKYFITSTKTVFNHNLYTIFIISRI